MNLPMIRAVAGREFLGYFRAPVAYVFLAGFVVASVGLPWFLGRFFEQGEASLRLFFLYLPWVFSIFIPAVGMRLWAEEKKEGTWELLLTLPMRPVEAVLGKFFAAWAFVGVALLLTLPLALTVEFLGNPDWGPILAGYLGAMAMAAAAIGVACLSSCLTRSQVVAFVLGSLLCLGLVLTGFSRFNSVLRGLGLPVPVVDGIANFSFMTHFEPMTRGLVAFSDLGFFAVVAVFSLWMTTVVLDR